MHSPLIADKNECDTSNGGCAHSCINTIGSYYCECDDGYQLASNGKSCNGMTLVACQKCIHV